MFDVLKWKAELAESQFSYNALSELLEDRKALQYHLSGYGIMEIGNGKISTREITANDFKDEDDYLNSYIDKIKQVIDIYRRQMIVLVVTYLEGIVFDFMESLFATFPSRMYGYLDAGAEQNLKGKVDLKDILNADTKDELLRMLSRRSASVATRGKFEAAVGTLEKTAKVKLDAVLIEKLRLLVELRNRIVHEASKENITDQTVREGFEAANDFLQSLGRVAAEKKMPLNHFSDFIEENVES